MLKRKTACYVARSLSGEEMWSRIAEWIGPTAPKSLEEGEALVLGVLVLLGLTVSLPFLFGFLVA